MDSRSGLTHSAVVTAVNVHSKHPLPDLLHGQERRVYSDSVYASKKKLIEGKAPKAKNFINQRTRRNGVLNEAKGSTKQAHKGCHRPQKRDACAEFQHHHPKCSLGLCLFSIAIRPDSGNCRDTGPHKLQVVISTCSDFQPIFCGRVNQRLENKFAIAARDQQLKNRRITGAR